MTNQSNDKNLRRDFANREELIAYLQQEFPQSTQIDGHTTNTQGGRSFANAILANFDAGKTYRNTRNNLDGQVSRLSPYIRHGVISLAEIRDDVLRRFRPYEAEKFINELGWRDFFQRNYQLHGDAIWDDIEHYKTGFPAESYAQTLPEDIRQAETGIPFIDDFVHELVTTGYLHNHARMWLAAYVVHWRRICWQAGASWFLEHLLDGDPASNNLSWQWVASTFSHKPYYYNIDNIRKYTGTRYTDENPAYEPFTGSYERIAHRLFPHAPELHSQQSRPQHNNRHKKSSKRRR
jgi:deoxyribodipyrimidine photo-lyase